MSAIAVYAGIIIAYTGVAAVLYLGLRSAKII
jgi:Cytochrome B6-F complex subunit VI (PetL)